MGVVYRAKDRRLKRTVAIKVLPPELAFRSEIKTRFLREAETAAQLNHPNIVDIYAVDEAEGIVYFVMAYITGDNLAKRLHQQGAMSVDETRRVLRDVADALAYAHERGVIHRDIKPDNILIDAQSGRPMVTDFGIARAVTEGDSRLTATGIAIGTPTYMSPEQAAGERAIDGRSDLYSLGVVGYQMLTGEPPFTANSTPAILVKHISEQPTPVEQRRSDVPPDLARIIMTLLEKEPSNRFPSASAVVVALDTGKMPPRPVTATTSAAPSAPKTAGIGVAPTWQSATGLDGTTADYAAMGPTPEEWRRWNADPVVRFRKKLAPYLFVNGVIVIASVVGQSDFFGITVLWSIYLAFKYAKLWADGYDWRDVFRQPRERDLIDVADDFFTYLRSMFDRNQRQVMREQRRARLTRSSGQMALPRVPLSGADVMNAAGTHGERVRRAESDRNEILALLDRMPSAERSRIPDVGRSAEALADKVRGLAVVLSDLERSNSAGGSDALEAEISRLENAANPLDSKGSEERVRRLAYLKRQRRSIADLASRRDAVAAKLETCMVALQNIKLDLVRLNAGSQTPQHITSLALDALNLADSVDSALVVSDDVRGNSRQASGQAAR
jgi:serine/threonine-protein kinase